MSSDNPEEVTIKPEAQPGAESSIIEAAGDPPIDLGSASEGSVPDYETVPYDPTKARESIRGWIALSLIAMLAVVVSVSLAMTWIHPDRDKELHELLALVFAPLVALVGSATGYYFGSQASQSK